MTARHPASSQTHCSAEPFGCKTGVMLNDRSIYCINPIQTQSGVMNLNTSFRSIRNSARNGTRKCPNMRISPIVHQEPFSRNTYQNVSSGMLAFQITKYWPKRMYAEKTVKANSREPKK